MNSAFFERVHGFLNNKSVSHSVELWAKSGVVPASSSSQCSMGVTSTAKAGPKAGAPPLTFQLVAAPNSRIAIGSFSAACEKAAAEQRRRLAINAIPVAIVRCVLNSLFLYPGGPVSLTFLRIAEDFSQYGSSFPSMEQVRKPRL